MAAQDPAVSVCFVVKLDFMDLGAWNSCEGLGCEVVIEQREEGGNNGLVWQLPTRIKYPNIKLSRPLTKETKAVTTWFAQAARGGGKRAADVKQSKTTGVIEARTADGTVVAKWGLLDVVPVRWTGPSLNPDSPKVATETIEIAHHGFVD
ncbi:MAG: phage tail protein [Pseudonocardiaceae bacterium]